MKLILICGPWSSGTSAISGMLHALGLDGFGSWLRYGLDISGARMLMPGVPLEWSAQVGLKCWRALRLAIPDISVGATSLLADDLSGNLPPSTLRSIT